MFRPGQVWNDTEGKPIQAHGGGVLLEGDTYYFYGEDKGLPNTVVDGQVHERHPVIGVHAYSSPDLIHWTDHGVVLPSVADNPSHDLYVGSVLERPKVVKCPATGHYVLFCHIDSADYSRASIGVAVSEHPTGPFRYHHSIRPGGHDSRDLTVFQDDDGAGYIFFSSEGDLRSQDPNSGYRTHWNATQRIARLTDDYLSVVDEPVTAFQNQFREAPAVFKWRGQYYQITSGCTGWAPNRAQWHVANSPLGPWKTGGDPCIGDVNGTTFDSQSTYVLPLPKRPDDFIFLADRWKALDLQDSRYVWLPLSMASGEPRIEWRDEWSI